jgi:DNA-binding YbaB/EbfC family protein
MTNIQELMQMGQQLQARMAQLQEELSAREISASSGGGMVTATVDGKGTVTRIVIDSTVADPRDVEMLEDLVLAAVTQAQGKAQGQYEEDMRKAAGGMPIQIPGLF